MLFYYLPFMVSALLSMLGGKRKLCYWGLAALLIAMCAFQAPGVSDDHGNYLDYYAGIVSGEFGPFFVEPTFFVLAKLSSLLTGSAILLFVFYAALGVGSKFYVMERATPYRWLSVAIYLSYFFLLQDFTQIRIGVATGLVMCAAYLVFNGQWSKGLAVLSGAVFFHYSAILFLPFMLLRAAGVRTVFYIYLCCCALFALYLLDVSVLKGFLQLLSLLENPRLDFYIDNILSGQGGSINFFRAIFHFALLTPLVLMFARIQRHQPFIAYSVILHLSGLLILLALHDAQVVAYRISDIFNHFMVFSLLAYAILFGRVVGAAGMLAVSTFQIIYVLQVLGFVQPYTSVLGGL
ncbi:EpsG family protein [Pseudomonas sp. 2835]|uniref:EpsG family protein n=1 Tax=Pseudomonas sp. 2835 TaxID=3156451 RepID=UPI003D1F52C5